MRAPFSTEERNLALVALDRWLGAPERQADIDQALSSFLSVALPPHELADPDGELSNPNFQALMSGWLEADAPLDDFPCAALAVLEAQPALATGSQRYLRLLADSVLGFHELQEPAGDDLVLLDLLSGERHRLPAPPGADALEVGDILAARLLPGSHDQARIPDCLVLLPGNASDIRILLHEYRKGMEQQGDPELMAALQSEDGDFVFAKLLAPVAGRIWMAGLEDGNEAAQD